MSIQTVDATDHFYEFLRVFINTPIEGHPTDPANPALWGAPLVIWGPPSTAKTGRIRSLSSPAMPVFAVNGGTLKTESTDGIPIFMKPGELPLWVPADSGFLQATQHQHSILFLDEVSLLPTITQNALLGVVQKREVGSIPLPRGCRILMAGNPVGTNQGARPLNKAFANRCGHVDVPLLPQDEWRQHLRGQRHSTGINLVADAHLVAAEWDNLYPDMVGKVIGFCSSHSDAYQKEPGTNDPASGRAWPSPRSWDGAIRVATTGSALGLKKLVPLLVESMVGPVAEEFWLWVKNQDIPDVVDVLTRGWKPDPQRVDVAYAVANSITTYVLGKKLNTPADQMVRYWETMTGLCQAGMADLVREFGQEVAGEQLGTLHPNKDVKRACAATLRSIQ